MLITLLLTHRFASAARFFLLTLALAAPMQSEARRVILPSLNVLTDPSLTLPISVLAREYAKEKNVSISTSFASARLQSENIVAGLEADIFITTRENILQTLKNQGLIDVYSQRPVARNRLSLVSYASNTLELAITPKLQLEQILSRVDPGFSFIIGDPNFQSAGIYAVRALRTMELDMNLEPHMLFVRSPVDVHRTIAQKGSYGIMYRSEATRNAELKTLGVFPEVSHSPIIYYGVVVAGENMENARGFLTFLQSDRANEIFVRFGFETMQTYEGDNGHLARGSTSSSFNQPL